MGSKFYALAVAEPESAEDRVDFADMDLHLDRVDSEWT